MQKNKDKSNFYKIIPLTLAELLDKKTNNKSSCEDDEHDSHSHSGSGSGSGSEQEKSSSSVSQIQHDKTEKIEFTQGDEKITEKFFDDKQSVVDDY